MMAFGFRCVVVVVVTLGVVFCVGCGPGPASTVERDDVAEAKQQVNNLVQAIVARDPRGLERVLSRNLLDAARSQGGDLDATVLAAFESQRTGLLAQFGEADAVGEVGVERLVPLEGGEVAAVVSIGGTTLERPLYLVVEDGEYRFAGAHPEGRAVATESVAGAQVSSSGSASNMYDWPHWLFDNSANPSYVDVLCGNTLPSSPSDTFEGAYFYLYERTSIRHTCPSWKCTFFGSTCTYVWGDPKPCYYQVVGRDVWWDSSGRRHCFQ